MGSGGMEVASGATMGAPMSLSISAFNTALMSL